MRKIDKNQLDLFGPQVWYEYLIVISPDEEITKEINVRKKKINALLGADVASTNSVPHISLLNFLHTEHEMILKRMKDILSRQAPFPVKLNGVAFFEPTPESKILYARVAEKPLIQSLTSQLKTGIGRGTKSNPHLTILGAIPSKNHEILHAHLAELTMEVTFLCKGVTVLRRLKDDPTGIWDFSLNLPFNTMITEKDTV